MQVGSTGDGSDAGERWGWMQCGGMKGNESWGWEGEKRAREQRSEIVGGSGV
jgi:hypothetical protein